MMKPIGRYSVIVAVAVWAGALAASCRGSRQDSGNATPGDAALSVFTQPSASASTRRVTHPPPAPESVKFQTSDGVMIEASLYVGGEASSPAIILAHRMAGNRTEWSPLLERLFPPTKPWNVLALDMRGHGTSIRADRALAAKAAASATGKTAHQAHNDAGKSDGLAWNEFQPADFAAMAKDVEAAIRFLDRRPGGPPSTLIMLGSDVGATAVTLAAKGLGPRLQAVGLISPGAALRGVDIYRPFAAVLTLPNLIAAGMGDNASAEPANALHAMSKRSTFLRFDANLHSAEYLGRQNPDLWDQIADWVEDRVQVASTAVPADAGKEASGGP